MLATFYFISISTAPSCLAFSRRRKTLQDIRAAADLHKHCYFSLSSSQYSSSCWQWIQPNKLVSGFSRRFPHRSPERDLLGSSKLGPAHLGTEPVIHHIYIINCPLFFYYVKKQSHTAGLVVIISKSVEEGLKTSNILKKITIFSKNQNSPRLESLIG